MLRVAVGQLHLRVGDLEGNRDRIGSTMDWAEEAGADVLVLPELAVTGYPPEDLLHAGGFVEDNLAVVDELAARARETVTIVGFVDPIEARAGADSAPRNLANAVAFLWQGQVRGRYHKVLLPNYGVFDERRYFAPGDDRGATWALHGTRAGVLVCEDLWRPDLADEQAAAGAQVLLVANASPYHRRKPVEREALVVDTARRCGTPLAYTNMVGGQDEVVFDGGSLVADARGQVLARAPLFAPACFVVDLLPPHEAPAPGWATHFVCRPAPRPLPPPAQAPPLTDPSGEVEEVYRALVRGLEDFVAAHDYKGAVVGLSGGVDSALVATLAADALGPGRVRGVTLPAAITPADASEDAAELARRLGIHHDAVAVEHLAAGSRDLLAGLCPDRHPGDAEAGPGGDGGAAARGDGDLLPRLRGALLLACAARAGEVVLTTGNKTETALGYGALGGDVAGGFAVLRDVPKTLVYALCHWRSGVDGRAYGWAGGRELIPEHILTKPPSAEGVRERPDRQVPAPYDVVDAILERFVELGRAPADITAEGFPADVVERVVELVEQHEPLRQQMPPGVKVTARAFGRDRRMPLAHGYRHRRAQPAGPPPTGEWLEG